MKKILITGKDSYIGTSFENWLSKEPARYEIDTLDMKDPAWQGQDFSQYDVVFHVAGIAHVSSAPHMEELYYRVNRDLAIETAKKAKDQDVKQFIFMSSIIVYGEASSSKRVIDRNTVPKPSSLYGLSKLQAEEGLRSLESESFKIAVLRPPMIYGKGSKGNYAKLAAFAKRTPGFPDFDNMRSMLHIDNLCELLKALIDNAEAGLFFPQNAEYVKTSDMVRLIAEVHGKNILMTKLCNPVLRLMLEIGVVNKIFGNLVYEKSLSAYDTANYQVISFRESLELAESESEEI